MKPSFAPDQPKIRPALAEDIGVLGGKGIRDLFNAVRRAERRAGRSPLAPPHYGAWARQMARQAAGTESAQVLVAERRGEIVGFCLAVHRDNGISRLDKLFVAEKMQGCGLGRRFIDAVTARAKKQGSGEIQTAAEAGADRASAFYRRLGFRITASMQTAGGVRKNKLSLKI